MTASTQTELLPETRKRDAEATKADILRVATEEFATRGYNGARVDQIAEETATTKRMIYYYFGSKQGLYLSVLEGVYTEFRILESDLDLDSMNPVDALRALAEFTYHHHASHPNFVRLIQIENVNRAEHLKTSMRKAELAGSSMSMLEKVMKQGIENKLFRDDLEAFDVHMMISAYSIFQIANRHTFNILWNKDLSEKKYIDKYAKLAGELVVKTLLK